MMTHSARKKPTYIAIEGCIGVGKTTLCSALAKRFSAAKLLEEVEENPFLAEFYNNPAGLAFKTQIFFLLSRYKQQQQLGQRDLFAKAVVADYFIAKDKIFAELTLQGSELSLYEQLYSTLCNHIHTPELVVYLRAPIDVIMNRIQSRGRSFERTIERDYLIRLMDSYDRFFSQFSGAPVLIVETEELNFPARDEDVSYMIDVISETLSHGKSLHIVRKGESKQIGMFA